MLQQEKPNYEKILEYCEYVLEYTPENIKAHYRKGLALYHMNNFEKAIDFFHQASDIAKDSKGDYCCHTHCSFYQLKYFTSDIRICIATKNAIPSQLLKILDDFMYRDAVSFLRSSLQEFCMSSILKIPFFWSFKAKVNLIEQPIADSERLEILYL